METVGVKTQGRWQARTAGPLAAHIISREVLPERAYASLEPESIRIGQWPRHGGESGDGKECLLWKQYYVVEIFKRP